MRGIILAAGTGTRLGLLTKAVNKHLLPLGYEPMVCRAVRTLTEAGINDLVVVAGCEHVAAFRRLLGDGHRFGARTVKYVCQEAPAGIADAIGTARNFGKAVVLLADNIFEESLRRFFLGFHQQAHGARVLLKECTDTAVLMNSGVPVFDESSRIERVEEKPVQPRSKFVVTGVYFFDESLWGILPHLEPSARGELEIADVLNDYARRGLLEHDMTEGFWCDAGSSVFAYQKACDFVRCQEALPQ